MKTLLLTLVLILAIGEWVRGVRYDKRCNKYECESCGNGYCETFQGENCKNCPSDCGSCPTCSFCGDKSCGDGESSCNCPQDCGPCCVDGVCSEGESFDNCPKDCAGYISGTVFDAKTSLPLKTSPFTPYADTNVTCYARDSVCSRESSVSGSVCSSGAFTFGPVRPGFWTCKASLDGYNSNSQSVEVTPGEPSVKPSFQIPLTKYPTTISGRTFSGAGTGLLPLAAVTCSSTTSNLVYKRESDQDGTFYFETDPGTYSCVAQKDGYATAQQTVTVATAKGVSVNLNLNLIPLYINGLLLNSQTQQPIEGATVSCSHDESKKRLAGSKLTDSDGSFVSGGAALGSFSCTFSKPSFYGPSSVTGCFKQPGHNETVVVYLDPVVLPSKN